MSTVLQLEVLRQWAQMPSPADRLDKSLVHKLDARNVFVARVEAVPQGLDEHVAELAIDREHPYHFEHPQDHVPGMMLVEAGRQLAMAIAHIFYKVPLDAVFVLDEVTINFRRFAELSAPIYVHSKVREKQYRRDQLTSMSNGGDFLQDGEVVGTLTGRWTMYDRALISRLRRRAAVNPAAPVAVVEGSRRVG
jgi:2-oxo-3-(phosphooxy)propyl 3-oxoalkanoate synthase